MKLLPRSIGGCLIAVAVAGAASISLGIGAMLLASMLPPRMYELGQEKGFGGPDSHLMLAVMAVERRPLAGERDRFEVRVRVRNSAVGDLTLDPSRLRFVIEDASGAEYERPEILDAPSREQAGAGDRRLTRLLEPNDRYEARIRFEVPRDVRHPRLWVFYDDLLARRLPFRKRNVLVSKLTFLLPERSTVAPRGAPPDAPAAGAPDPPNPAGDEGAPPVGGASRPG